MAKLTETTKFQMTSATSPTGAEVVRAALAARSSAEAGQVNDMIELLLGARFERFIGDRAANHGLITTPGDYDHKALEPVTNMHDALLERFAREKFGTDLSAVPYKTPHEAAEGLLGSLSRAEKAQLARVDIFEADPPAKETKLVTLVFRDQGIGIANRYIAGSIFHLGSSHKQTNLWQQGAFGLGATTCYPNAAAVVLVTRRPPHLLDEGEEDVVSVAVAEWQQHQKGRGIYYLVTQSVDDDPGAAPLAVAASEVPEFEPGTYLALVSYATHGFHTGRNDRQSLEFVLNTRLWRPPLPVTLMNHVAKGDHPKIHQGRGPHFDANPRADRKAFPDTIPFAINGVTRHLPVEVHYFEKGYSSDVGGMRNFIAQGHAVLLLANGQTHKHWDPPELGHRVKRLTKLTDRILVVVNLDAIPVDIRTSTMFTADRVDLVQSQDAVRLEDTIAATLNSWRELLDLNADLIREALQSRGDGRSTAMIAERIRAQLAFRGGVSLSSGDRDGEGLPPKRKWGDAELWADPTTIEGPDRVRAVPGKTRFVHYQLNARPEFFASGRGKLDVSCDHPRVGTAELVAGGELRGGMVRVSILVPEDVAVGTSASITAGVRNWTKAAGGIGEDLEWTTELEVVDNGDGDKAPKPKRQRKGGGSVGSEVAVLWHDNSYAEDWNSSVPGAVDMIPASVLASQREEYQELSELGEKLVPTVVLNLDYAPLRKYEAERLKKFKVSTVEEGRDRYAIGVGVGMLVLEDQAKKQRKDGKKKPTENTLTARQAVARSALALMPDFDRLVKEAGLAPE